MKGDSAMKKSVRIIAIVMAGLFVATVVFALIALIFGI